MKRLGTLLQALRRARRAPGAPSAQRLSIAALFDATLEAMLIIDAGQGTVVEANPAAANLLGRPREELAGVAWLGLFSGSSVLGLTKLEAITHAAGRAEPIRAAVRASSREVEVALSLVRTASHEYLLCHLLATPGDAPGEPPGGAAPSDVLAGISEAFAVTDPGLRILYANAPFAECVGVRSASETVGKSLTRWLEFSQADLDGLATQMQAREATSMLRIPLRPARGPAGTRAVDLTVVAVPDEPQRCFGFWLRDDSSD